MPPRHIMATNFWGRTQIYCNVPSQARLNDINAFESSNDADKMVEDNIVAEIEDEAVKDTEAHMQEGATPSTSTQIKIYVPNIKAQTHQATQQI